MPDGYLKCTCAHCGGRIEFPVDGIGSVAPCPHCGRETELSLEAPSEFAEETSRSRKWLIAGVVILTVGIVGGIGALLLAKIFAKKARDKRGARIEARAGGKTENVISTPERAANAKSVAVNDFAISDVKLEKKPGSTLVYATGNVRNTANKPRFGVTVELDLLDSSGAKIGAAKDYKEALDPRAEWTYRALVVPKGVTSARVADVREQ
jgi:hypothetical protein